MTLSRNHWGRYVCLVWAISSLIVLSACGSIPPTVVSGNNLSTEHGTARTTDALLGAQEYCMRKGMDVRLVRTDCPYMCMSTFECVSN